MKVKVTIQLDFEQAYFEAATLYFSHYAIENSSCLSSLCFNNH